MYKRECSKFFLELYDVSAVKITSISSEKYVFPKIAKISSILLYVMFYRIGAMTKFWKQLFSGVCVMSL